MISKIRRFIGKSNFVKNIFNHIGGSDYAVYDSTNVIYGSKYIDYFVTFDGAKYKVDGCSNFTVGQAQSEYDWSDLRKDDIVLDIGANVGGFAIGAALKVKHVYAIEPIFYKELEENIELNNISNITILPIALGDGIKNVTLSFFGKKREDAIPTYTFKDICKIIQDQNNHTISFLKCDCEGYEWYITPSDLDGIRKIEMEIHPYLYPTKSYNPELIPYIKEYWNTTFTEEWRDGYMLHASLK